MITPARVMWCVKDADVVWHRLVLFCELEGFMEWRAGGF